MLLIRSLEPRTGTTNNYQKRITIRPAIDIEACYDRCYDDGTICEYDFDGNPYNCFTKFSCLRSCQLSCRRFRE